MRAVIQAVSSASVRVNGGEPRAIGPGLMILLGVKDTDSLDIVPKLADKCAGLRIFSDAEGKLNLSAEYPRSRALRFSSPSTATRKKATAPALSRPQNRPSRWMPTSCFWPR